LIGNIKPVVEKSHSYSISDLTKRSKDWKKLPPSQERFQPSPSGPSTEGDEEVGVSSQLDISDRSFQSGKTASIISLTSTCRPMTEVQNFALEDYMKHLLLGFTEVLEQDQEHIKLAGQGALRSTIEGVMNGQTMKIRAVVLKKHRCIYDLLLVARKNVFESHADDFEFFAQSLRIDD
jgi:hypothetical protein